MILAKARAESAGFVRLAGAFKAIIKAHFLYFLIFILQKWANAKLKRS